LLNVTGFIPRDDPKSIVGAVVSDSDGAVDNEEYAGGAGNDVDAMEVNDVDATEADVKAGIAEDVV
jgi:hypothetical protein